MYSRNRPAYNFFSCIRYLHMYLILSLSTSTDRLLVLGLLYHLVVSVSALTYYCLFKNILIFIKLAAAKLKNKLDPAIAWVIIAEFDYHDLCPLGFFLPQTRFKLVGFLISWLWVYLLKIILETCDTHRKFDAYVFIIITNMYFILSYLYLYFFKPALKF